MSTTVESLETAHPARHGLIWPIKSSFTTYVESMSDGEVAVFDGAQRLPNGSFLFPLESDDTTEQGTVLTFSGTVQFNGHRGMLVITLAGLRLIDDGASGSLSIADSLMPDGRLKLVELPSRERAGQTTRYPDPTLTEDGADLFFENYAVGTVFEPLWLIALEAA